MRAGTERHRRQPPLVAILIELDDAPVLLDMDEEDIDERLSQSLLN